MTPDETLALASLAKQLLPRSTDEQCALLRRAVEPYPFAAAKEVLMLHAAESADNRLLIAWITQRLDARTAADPRRLRRVADEVRQHRERREIERLEAGATHAAALAFCRAHEGELAGWVEAVLRDKPFLAKRCVRGRAVLDNPVLVGLIFETYGGGGKVGVE